MLSWKTLKAVELQGQLTCFSAFGKVESLMEFIVTMKQPQTQTNFRNLFFLFLLFFSKILNANKLNVLPSLLHCKEDAMTAILILKEAPRKLFVPYSF